MNIRSLLEENGYDTSKINDDILDFDCGICDTVRSIPNDISKLFEGVEIYDDCSELKIITLNFDYFNGDDEFLPMTVGYVGVDGYLSVEVYYDENLNVEFINDLR